jgi:hypothetical protein
MREVPLQYASKSLHAKFDDRQGAVAPAMGRTDPLPQ